MDDWAIRFHKFEPEKEGIREALCTLGNGYFAIRGAAEESLADEMHYPGTYLAGGYNRLQTKIKEKIIENEDLVNFPNFLLLSFRIEGDPWFNLTEVEILSYEQTLHMQTGILTREIRFLDQQRRLTNFSTKRLVSMHHPHTAAIQMVIYPENWEGCIEVLSALDGRVENAGVERYMNLNRKHLESIIEEDLEGSEIYLKVKTNQSNIQMALAAVTRIFLNGKEAKNVFKGVYKESGYISKIFKLELKKNQPLCIEKLISVYTSKDFAISECGIEAKNSLKRLSNFEKIYQEHAMAWRHIWKRFDIQMVHGSQNDVSKLLRLHIFHLLQTTSLHSLDLDVGVPPRGWHGEAYRGHIFWDELFVFSTLNLQFPELTRALLLYRYRRLPAARRIAQAEGLQGAIFPWQSGSDGQEESQEIHLNPLSGRWVPDNSHLQKHVNAAIAFNIWQHYEVTGDLDFFSFYGAEIILEIARGLSALSIYNQESGRYEIQGVMGPDEFHDSYPDREAPGLNNNAYTNVMTSWVLSRALQALEILPKDRREELQEILLLREEELENWKQVSKKLYIPFHEGVISQFEGYEKLKEIDLKSYAKKYGNIQRMDRILENEKDNVNRYKVSKQADVLMLFYLFSAEELRAIFKDLGYELKKETIQKTIDYYMKRTSNGSTLSKMIHSWVVSRLDRKKSWGLFCEAIHSDIEDVQEGTTAEGIHLGAMAGTIDLIQRCYSGIEFRDGVLYFHPQLPEELKRLQTVIRYRGHSLWIQITHKKITITSERALAKSIQIAFQEKFYLLKEGQTREFTLSK